MLSRLLHGDYRSVVDRITAEFMDAIVGYRFRGDGCMILPVKDSWRICRLEMTDRFMTVSQRNYLYHLAEIRHFKQKTCLDCICITDPEHAAWGFCEQTEEDVERCWQQAEDKKWADRAAPFWLSDCKPKKREEIFVPDPNERMLELI